MVFFNNPNVRDAEWHSSGTNAEPVTLTVTVTDTTGLTDAANIVVRAPVTVATDTVPDHFSFTTALNASVTSNAITVTGINSAADITVKNGSYSLDGGKTFTDKAGLVTNGQAVILRGTPTTAATDNVVTLTIGGVSGEFIISPLAVTTPPPFLFIGNDSTGPAIWRTDGTAGSTQSLKQIGNVSYSIHDLDPKNIVQLKDAFYFVSKDIEHGMELFKYANNQVSLVKDINPGSAHGTSYGAPVVFKDALYFIANDGARGIELWKSDGTAEGTVIFTDLNPGLASSNPGNLTVVGNTLYFSTNIQGFTTGLWKSDGTADGTELLKKDLYQCNAFTVAGSTLYFVANDLGNGSELWKSEGTTDSTVMVKDIKPEDSGGSGLSNLTAVGTTLYFFAFDITHGAGLWKSNGTTASTTLIEDFNTQATNSVLSDLTAIGSTLYFVADDGEHGAELWKMDAATNIAVMVKDINPDQQSSSPGSLTVLGTTLYFIADDGEHGKELWKSNGTAESTELVKDINPNAASTKLYNLVAAGDVLYFSANDAEHGEELWHSDGTADGTALVIDLWAGANSGFTSGEGGFVTSTLPTQKFTVGGTVSGVNGTGLVLQLNKSESLPIAANGSFAFNTTLASDVLYDVRVIAAPSAQECSVSNDSGVLKSSDITNILVSCRASTADVTVGGVVNGLTDTEGLILGKSAPGSFEVITVTQNGDFAFNMHASSIGEQYTVNVRVHPPTQVCTVSNGSGEFTSDNITNISVNCVPDTCVVGSTVDEPGVFANLFGTRGNQSGQFEFATSVAADNDNIFVMDTDNNRVQIFDKEGAFVRAFGARGNQPGQFEFASGIAVDDQGSIFVIDTENHRVQVFNKGGVFLRSFGSRGDQSGQFEFASDIAVDENNIYVMDTNNNRVQVFDKEGTFVRAFGSRGAQQGQFEFSTGIAVDENNIFVMDTSNNRVQIFDKKGKFVRAFGSRGDESGQFEFATDIAVNKDNIFVMDTDNNRVQIFDKEGAFIKSFGRRGIDKKGYNDGCRFEFPNGIAVDNQGNIFVIDTSNNRVQVFK